MSEKGETSARYQEDSKDPVLRYFEDLYNNQQLRTAEEIVSSDCELHGFPGISESGPEGVKELVERQHQRFPGRRQDVQDVLRQQKGDDKYAVARWILHDASTDSDEATDDGSDGIAGMTSFRITDGKISEIWVAYTQVPSDVEEQEAPTSFLDIGQMLAAYIGIPAILLYPVGFLVFVLQVWNFYPFDFSTAWYAASLIPVTVATGQGVKYLLMPLVISVIVSSVLSSVFARRLIVEYRKALQEGLEQNRDAPTGLVLSTLLRRRRERLMWLLAIALVVLLLTVALVVFFALKTGREGILYWAFFIPLGAISGLIGSWRISSDYYETLHTADDEQLQGATRSFSWLLRGVRERWVFRGLLLAYGGSVLSAFFIVFILDALDQDLDLPHVTMDVSGRPTIEDGLLLSHSDGYWHVIDTSRVDHDNRVETKSFVISPGKDVSDVSIFESPLKQADLDARIELDDSAWLDRTLKYTVKVTNVGPDAATDVRLTNDLPSFVSAPLDQANPDCEAKKNIITCDLEELDVDDTTEIDVLVRPEERGSLPVATINVDGTEIDPDPNVSDEIKASIGFWVDATTAGGGAYAPGTWTNRDVTVDLTAADNEGSGPQKLVYSIGGAQIFWRPFIERVVEGNEAKLPTITADGTTTISYRAEDAAGNVEEGKSFTVKLDKTAPESTMDDSSPNGWIKNNKPTFAVSGSDNLTASKNLRFSYRVDNGEDWAEVPGRSVTLGGFRGLTDGLHTFTVRAKDKAGNKDRTPEERSFTVDTTPPHLELSSDIIKEATSENGAEVRYEATATDENPANPEVRCSTGSGSVSAGDAFSIGTTTVTCTATDAAGNKAPDSFHVTVQDTTPPQISGMPSDIIREATRPDGVRVNWTTPNADDVVDDAPDVHCSSESDLSSGEMFPLGTTRVGCTASDEASNDATRYFDVTVQDTTAPKTKINRGPSDWITRDSTSFRWTASDTVTSAENLVYSHKLDSGAWSNYGTATSVTLPNLDEGQHTFYVRAKDQADNEEAREEAAQRAFSVDTIAPSIQDEEHTPQQPDSHGWYNTAVTNTFTASDGNASGLADPDEANFRVASVDEGTAVRIDSGTVSDLAGNEASSIKAGPFQIDLTDPELDITNAPAEGTIVDRCDGIPTPDFSAEDALSGLANTNAPGVLTKPGTDSGVGAYSYEAKAVDKAGNSSSVTRTYNVTYGVAYGGVLQPINSGDQRSVFKLGSTVPVKFELTCGTQPIADAAVELSVQQVDSKVAGPVNEAVSTATATTDNQFRYDSTDQQYSFDLSTKGRFNRGTRSFSTGTWRLIIELDDNTKRSALIDLER